jgi:hypothetical protein
VASDLQLDLEALSIFAGNLDKVRGQWDGSAGTLDPPIGLGADADLAGTMNDFSQTWAKAATSIDTFIITLSMMCRDTVSKFQSTDQAMANALNGPRVIGHHDYNY